MGDGNECRVSIETHRDEEAKDEISKQTQENEESSHVTLRHRSYVSRDEETGFSFNRKRDSLALESIYRYAKKIKSFLGWEKGAEDAEVSEKSVDCGNCSVGLKHKSHCSNSETADVRSSSSGTLENNKNEKLIEGKTDAIEDKTFCDLEAEELSGHALEDREFISLHKIGENEIKLNSEEEDLMHEYNSLQKIFRSEISIFVEDFRSDDKITPTSTENLIPELKSSKSDDFKSTDMNKSLVENNNTAEAGLVLSDAESILYNESILMPSCDTEIGFVHDSQKKVEFGENGIAKYEKTSSGEFKIENTSDERNSLEESTTKPLEDVRKSYLESVNGVTESDPNAAEVFNEENERNNDNHGPLDKSSESQKFDLREKNVLDDVKGSSPIDNGKYSIDHSSKECQAENAVNSTINSSLKAFVCFEKEKKKQSVSKEISKEKKDMSRKESLYTDDDTVCGLGLFKPRWLQSFATPKMYVILYSVIGILHGSYYSYLIGTLSTLEKRFAFKSKISGAIMVADEFTPLLLGVIIGYYAGKGHRPRLVAIGMLLSAGCCFASSLPYFIYGTVQHLTLHSMQNHTGSEFCNTDIEKQSCDLNDRPPTLPAVLFLVFGSFLKGFGNLAYYAIGLAYLDDNSDKKSTPIYLAVALALRLLGPLLGFLMSSAFLKLYENPFDDPGFGPDDPRWIGAWWMGFFLQGVLLVIFTLPIALFPRRLPSQKKVEKIASTANKETIRETLLGLVAALKRLAKNPIFTILIVNTTMKIFGHFGHAIMLPKYMENQFRLSAADASLFSGATSITCIMLSTVFGGFLIWKFRPRIKILLAGMVTSEIILTMGFLILMIPRCQPADMLHFGMDHQGLILNSICNQNCDCSTTSFTPFCGPDGKTTYFSPCYAGCTEEVKSNFSIKKPKEFGNCSCVNAADSPAPIVAKITEGFCPDESCWSQTVAYLVILFFLLMISNTLTVAHTMILLRSVHPSDKSVALGTFETFICLFGFIPFPVTYGALVDSACLVWEESCGETGNCWFYDMEKYGYLLHGASAFFCSLSMICLITLYFLSSRVRNLYVEEDEEEEYVNIKLDTVSGSVTKL